MSSFRKEKNCPSSYELAEIANGPVSGEQGLRIATHLASCDFCSAELEFYRAYPPEGSGVPAPPIPGPLRELAESLIGRETIHISRLEYLLKETL